MFIITITTYPYRTSYATFIQIWNGLDRHDGVITIWLPLIRISAYFNDFSEFMYIYDFLFYTIILYTNTNVWENVPIRNNDGSVIMCSDSNPIDTSSNWSWSKENFLMKQCYLKVVKLSLSTYRCVPAAVLIPLLGLAGYHLRPYCYLPSIVRLWHYYIECCR